MYPDVFTDGAMFDNAFDLKVRDAPAYQKSSALSDIAQALRYEDCAECSIS